MPLLPEEQLMNFFPNISTAIQIQQYYFVTNVSMLSSSSTVESDQLQKTEDKTRTSSYYSVQIMEIRYSADSKKAKSE